MNLLTTLKRLIGALVISFIATSPSANAAASVVVPGCAPIHPPTCVQWKKLDGEGWSVRNNCGAAVFLTLDKTSMTPNLSPGQVWPVGIKPPQYLVFDSDGWAIFSDSFKGKRGQFWNEAGFPCKEKLLVAQQSGGGNSDAGQASNCPNEAIDDREYTKAVREGDAIQFYNKHVTDNGWHPGYRAKLSDKGAEHLYCVENDSNFDKQVCRMYQCSNKQNAATPRISASAAKQSQLNVGNASETIGQRSDGKSAWNPNKSQPKQSPSQQESEIGAQGSNDSPKSKYVSKDATHCVELVPKGFKCDGPYDRFLTNICMTKISVHWRLGSDPWGMQELAPKGCTPVSPFRDQRGVQFKACSWDPKASHGPYSNPCRY